MSPELWAKYLGIMTLKYSLWLPKHCWNYVVQRYLIQVCPRWRDRPYIMSSYTVYIQIHSVVSLLDGFHYPAADVCPRDSDDVFMWVKMSNSRNCDEPKCCRWLHDLQASQVSEREQVLFPKHVLHCWHIKWLSRLQRKWEQPRKLGSPSIHPESSVIRHCSNPNLASPRVNTKQWQDDTVLKWTKPKWRINLIPQRLCSQQPNTKILKRYPPMRSQRELAFTPRGFWKDWQNWKHHGVMVAGSRRRTVWAVNWNYILLYEYHAREFADGE